MQAETIGEGTAPMNSDQTGPAIDIQNVTKSFGAQKVLDGVSFQVRRGETLAFLGRSGTGKSVLLRIIVGLQTPDTGAAVILGKNMAEASAADIGAVRTRMGFLFQHAALYDSLTIEENVAFPLQHHRTDMSPTQKKERAVAALVDFRNPDGPTHRAAKVVLVVRQYRRRQSVAGI